MPQLEKPTVVLATGIMNAGGTETLIMECLRHNSGRINYILLIHFDKKISKGVFDNEIKDLGIPIYYISSVGSIGVKKYIEEFRKFKQIVGKIDIIHSHLNGVGGVISFAAKRAGIKHRICHCHADIHFTGNLKNKLKSEMILLAYKILIEKYATQRWACSLEAWKRLYFPWNKKYVIYNMIDTQKYITSTEKRYNAKKKFNFSEKDIILGSVGRVAPIKNYETIIKVLPYINAHFVCFGRWHEKDPYYAYLKRIAQDMNVCNKIHWMGNSNNIKDDIHCIDIFVMPSYTEGFGMAAIEAQAASIPCLLSNGIPKIVDMGLGLVSFINPNNIQDWIDAIRKINKFEIIDSQNILNSFKEKKFESKSSVIEIENKYIDLLES